MIRRTVFVSYSRKDSPQVEKAVELLEAGGADIFRDIDDIQYGDRWETVIREKLAEAERVLVFWSSNALLSEWVNREWSIAIAMQKRVVPILLDPTPLPVELGQFHALTNFMFTPPAPVAAQSPKAYLTWSLLAVGGLGLAAVIGLMSLNLSHQSAKVSVEPNFPEQVTDSTSSTHSTNTTDLTSNTDSLTRPDTQTGSSGQDLVPSIKAPATGSATESQAQSATHSLVWPAVFLVLFTLIAYRVWHSRQRRQQQLQAGEQLIKDIFQE